MANRKYSQSYMDKCVETLHLNITVQPIKGLVGVAHEPRTLRLMQNGYAYMERRGKKKLSLLPIKLSTLIAHYEWEGKPVWEGPSRKGVKNGEGKRSGLRPGQKGYHYAKGLNPNSDNISPIWRFMRGIKDSLNEVELRLSTLEDSLGVKRV